MDEPDTPIDGASRKLTPEELAEVYETNLRLEHAQMLEAMQSEFNVRGQSDTEQAGKARKAILDNVQDAGDKLKWIINHSENDAVAAGAAKFVISEALKIADGDGITDPLDKLFEKLKNDKNDKKPATVNSGSED
jgi:hypothetical protein